MEFLKKIWSILHPKKYTLTYWFDEAFPFPPIDYPTLEEAQRAGQHILRYYARFHRGGYRINWVEGSVSEMYKREKE